MFGEELDELKEELTHLNSKTEEELKQLLDDVIFMVETRRSTAQARSLFVASMSIVEYSGDFVGLKLNGLSNIVAQSPEILKNVDEVALKYDKIVQLDPVARLALSIGQLCLALDNANRRTKNNEINKKDFNDL